MMYNQLEMFHKLHKGEHILNNLRFLRWQNIRKGNFLCKMKLRSKKILK